MFFCLCSFVAAVSLHLVGHINHKRTNLAKCVRMHARVKMCNTQSFNTAVRNRIVFEQAARLRRLPRIVRIHTHTREYNNLCVLNIVAYVVRPMPACAYESVTIYGKNHYLNGTFVSRRWLQQHPTVYAHARKRTRMLAHARAHTSTADRPTH